MIEFLKKYNMHLFIMIVAILTIYDLLNWNSISLVRKLVNVFAVLGILHEIEEKYWPGGFMELMLKKLKVNISDFDTETAKLNVVIFWLVYIFLGYVFDNIIFFVMMTVVLSLFEAFIHTAGIKIHKDRQSKRGIELKKRLRNYQRNRLLELPRAVELVDSYFTGCRC